MTAQQPSQLTRSGRSFLRSLHARAGSPLSRRQWLQLAALGVGGTAMSGWLRALAEDTAGHPDRRRACILLWMTGGPSQTDTFDLKPGHDHGGPFQEIPTSVPGIRISEHLPKLAKMMDHLALIRSMSTKEGDHTRATYLLRTGYPPQGPIHYPTLGSLLSNELGRPDAALPSYVSIAPYRFLSPAAYGPGFLGPRHAPLVVGDPGNVIVNQQGYADNLRVRNLDLPPGIGRPQADARLGLLDDLETHFQASRPGVSPQSHQAAYEQAVRMMRSDTIKAFSNFCATRCRMLR